MKIQRKSMGAGYSLFHISRGANFINVIGHSAGSNFADPSGSATCFFALAPRETPPPANFPCRKLPARASAVPRPQAASPEASKL